MPWFITFLLIAAAVLEVGGDAVIRTGLRGNQPLIVIGGCLLLSVYGILINLVKWDFSRMFGVYVALFAVAGVCYGRFVFRENVPVLAWVGLSLIILGGLLIQSGAKF